MAVTRSSGRMSRRPATKVWWDFSRACLLDNSITIVSQAPCQFSDNGSLDARIRYRASAGPARQNRRIPTCSSIVPKGSGGMWWCDASLQTAPACYPCPPTPQCARSGLRSKGRNPQAPNRLGVLLWHWHPALRGAAVHPGSRPAPQTPTPQGMSCAVQANDL
jgi:hypothetical protein